jgi:hypothetical protein
MEELQKEKKEERRKWKNRAKKEVRSKPRNMD